MPKKPVHSKKPKRLHREDPSTLGQAKPAFVGVDHKLTSREPLEPDRAEPWFFTHV